MSLRESEGERERERQTERVKVYVRGDKGEKGEIDSQGNVRGPSLSLSTNNNFSSFRFG